MDHNSSGREEPVRRPDSCPFCQSGAVGTLAKVITASTYWRCQACGEVWNLGRLTQTNRGPRRRSW
jgi:ribosomal protein L37AE/L43A